MIKERTLIYLLSALGVGFLFSLINPSLLFGYFITFPLIATFLMLFIPSELHKDWKIEWKNWKTKGAKTMFWTLLIILAPFMIFITLYNLNASLMMEKPIPFFNFSFLLYLLMALSSILLDHFYLRDWKPSHSFLLIFIRPLSLFLFTLFVPLKPFPILGGLFGLILFYLLIGIIFFYIRQLTLGLSKYYKTYASLYIIFFLVFILIFIHIFFRII